MLKLLIALIAICYALIYLAGMPGEVSVNFAGEIHQISFFWSGVILLASFALAIVVLVIFNFILDLPKTIKKIFTMRQNDQSRNDLQKSFSTLMLGDFNQSQKLALKRIHYSKTPGLHLLLAAFAAYKLDKIDLAIKYLNQSSYFLKEEEDLYAFESFKAGMQIDGGFLSEAQVILENLSDKLPRNSYLLDNLRKVYLEQKNFTKAYELLPKIKKAKVYDDEHYKQLESEITSQKLNSVMYSENLIQYTEFWNTISRHQKNNLAVKMQYFLGLVYLDGFKGKENQFNRLIFSNFHNDQIWQFLYANPQLGEKINRIKASRLIASQPPSLANVVLAKSYLDADEFDQAMKIAKDCAKSWQEIPIFKLMAEIYEAKDDKEKALECYRIINQKELSKGDPKNVRAKKSNQPQEVNENLVSLSWMDEEPNDHSANQLEHQLESGSGIDSQSNNQSENQSNHQSNDQKTQ